MVMKVRKFVDRSFARTVDLDLLRRLIDPYAEQVDFNWDALPADERERREAVFQLFHRADANFPSRLQFDLFNISILSTEPGARLIQDLAAEVGFDVLADIGADADDLRLTSRYIALKAWLDHRAIFDRALRVAAFWSFPAKHERDADRDDLEPRHDDEKVREQFIQTTRRYFASRYNGRYCDVRWFDEDDLVKVLVLHGSKSNTKNIDNDGAEDKVTFREIVQSTIEYDRARRSIAVGSASITDAKKLIKLFAEHVLGDSTVFDASEKGEIYSLSPLQRHDGNFRFRFPPLGDITNVTIREIRVDEGERRVEGRVRRSPWLMTIRDSQNALRRLGELVPNVELSDLRIVQARFDISIDVDGHETIVPVRIKPPRTLTMRDHSHERLILDMLEENGIRQSARAGQAAAAAE